MSELELDSRFVKRGYWVNLSKGPVMGQTINTDTQTGAIVIALLAVVTRDSERAFIRSLIPF
jgi:hypothetical protein